MLSILIILQIAIAVCLTVIILFQKSDANALGGLGGSGGGGNMGGLMSARGSKTFMSRMTALLATAFLVNSLALAVLSRGDQGRPDSIVDEITPTTAPATPVAPAVPEVPLAK